MYEYSGRGMVDCFCAPPVARPLFDGMRNDINVQSVLDLGGDITVLAVCNGPHFEALAYELDELLLPCTFGDARNLVPYPGVYLGP